MPIAPSIFSNSSFTKTNEDIDGDKNGATHKSVPNFKNFSNFSMSNMVGGNIGSSKIDDFAEEIKPTTEIDGGQNQKLNDNKVSASKSLIPR